MAEPGIHFLDAHGPEGVRLYAIGDVHGRLDLLAAMHRRIESELEWKPVRDWRVIHLGDYVDRGPESKGVIDFLIAARERDPRHLMLAGNHDIGFLDFLRTPEPEGLFMRFGGVQTALSYGVSLTADASWFGKMETMRRGHQALLEAMPPGHVDFLRSLPAMVCSDQFVFVHAGIRPGIALEAQDEGDLLNIREEFFQAAHRLDRWVVHGHTIVDVPTLDGRRIDIDTGAFQSGRLTALRIVGKYGRLLSSSD